MKIKFVCLFAIIASLFLSCKEADKNNNIGLMLLNQPSSTPKEEIPEIPEVEELKFSEGLEYELKDDDTLEVIGIGTCLDRNIIIPSEYEGKSVTSIGSEAFVLEEIKSVVIPSSIKTVGENAFSKCSYLQSVEFQCEELPDLTWTFSECSRLKNVKLPNKVAVLWDTFTSCTSLENVELPNDVTTLVQTFFYCTSLKSIKIPDGVKFIEGLFYGCSNLETVEIPYSVNIIKFIGTSNFVLKSLDNWYYTKNISSSMSAEEYWWRYSDKLKPADLSKPEVFDLLNSGYYTFVKKLDN